MSIFDGRPELGICSRDCSPVYDSDGNAGPQAFQCEDIESGEEIERWNCQAVEIIAEDPDASDAWRVARTAAVCRPDIVAEDGRTGLCATCSNDANCVDGACVDLSLAGPAQNRCASRCSDGDCPFGFRCQEATSIGGATASYCLPVTGSCEECIDRDGDGFGLGGTCDGRDCDDAQPDSFVGNESPCPSNDPACEGVRDASCNGIDSNCDGVVDSGWSETWATDGTPLYDSRSACGACGLACPASTSRTNYTCEVFDNTFACTPVCESNFSTCGAELSTDPTEAPDCEFDLRTSVEACGLDSSGACIDCRDELDSDNVRCNNGTCEFSSCPDGTADCSGPSGQCLVSLNTSVAHCGQCGRDCRDRANVQSASCDGGACRIDSCNGNFRNCDNNPLTGCETDTRTSSNHCGQCGTTCTGNRICNSGSCVCAPGFILCSGNCVRNDTTSNCGSCGNNCTGGRVCTPSGCACPSGTTLCGGQCRNTQTDASNCGFCGNSCFGFDCISGSCDFGDLIPCPRQDGSFGTFCGNQEECCNFGISCGTNPQCVDPRAGCSQFC